MAGKKKNSFAKYAFIGLIVALLACVSTGLIASSKVLTGIGMFTLEESQQNIVNIALQVSVGLLFIGLGVYAFLAPDTIRRIFTGRQARYGSNSLILTIAFVGILIAVNYIVFKNPSLFGAPWDMTQDQSNTLAPETLQILATLPGDVTATAFYTDNLDSTPATDLLQKFKDNSNGKFDFSVVNPDLDPVKARDAGITGDGKIMLQMGETKEIASFATETELVKTLIRLISPEARVVYFLQGHGEISLESGDVSYSVVKSTLEAKNYTVNTLNLLNTGEIPEDALAIVIAGPTKPVSKEEVALLKAYVDNGGSLVVLEDPRVFTDFGTAQDPLASYLAVDWGIKLNDDVVIDPVNSQNPFQAVSSLYNSSHPITQNLTSNLFVVLPQARSVSITSEKENVTQTWLISTIETAWGETDLNADQLSNDPNKDTQGPLYLAVAGENSATNGRVVVYGNSLFAIDGNFDVYGNGNMFINSVDWAAEQEDILNITTRPQTQRIFTPPTQVRFLILVLITVVVLPGLVVFFGISSWIARRKRG